MIRPKIKNASSKAQRKGKRWASSFVGNNQHSITSRFGLAVRVRREQLGMTQTELAKQSGLNRSYLSELEHGLVGISLERAEQLAKALNCTLSDLLN